MINYTGLRKRNSYDEVVNYIQKDQPKIKYPNRDATRLLNTPQYSSLLELDGLDEQEEEIKKAQIVHSIGATQLAQHLARPPAAPTPIQIMHASSCGGGSTSIAPTPPASIALTQPPPPQVIPRPQASVLDLLRGPRRRQQQPATAQQQQAPSQQQTLADLFDLQRNAHNYARQHPTNPTSAALAVDDAEDYDDPEDDDDYGDAISMYGDSISHTIAQQHQTEEENKIKDSVISTGTFSNNSTTNPTNSTQRSATTRHDHYSPERPNSTIKRRSSCNAKKLNTSSDRL